tara:strand:- start:17 stop:217 length:201 start_codon:yes stop_codon:yes gene_type:complete
MRHYYPNITAPHSAERLPAAQLGNFRSIVNPAQVRQHDTAHLGAKMVVDKRRYGLVRQMPVVTADA